VINTYSWLGATWYWTSYAYADEADAERAWLRLERVSKKLATQLGLGFYRHGTQESGMVFVTAVGLKRSGVEVADKTLQPGLAGEPQRRTLEALIARRVRVVADLYATAAPEGFYEQRLPKGGGVTLNPDGTMRE
jgi:hypothetical protein